MNIVYFKVLDALLSRYSRCAEQHLLIIDVQSFIFCLQKMKNKTQICKQHKSLTIFYQAKQIINNLLTSLFN
jgi:hypothetical protein